MKEGRGVLLLTCSITYFICEINEAEVPPAVILVVRLAKALVVVETDK